MVDAGDDRIVVGGRYVLTKRLGEGGMGNVHSAEDDRMRRPVAVKLLQDRYLDNERMLKRFEREWQTTGRLQDVHVIRAYDCGRDEIDGRPVMYLVMELLDGASLRERMDEETDRRLPMEQVIKWAVQVCRGLEAAHGVGLVHRDLKPANVQITDKGRVVLLDFGIACFQEDEEGHTQITPADEVMGTVHYMSPEQGRGGPVSPASDLYSLGCLLYAMVTGGPPFQGTKLHVLGQHQTAEPVPLSLFRDDSDLPAELNGLVMRLLAKRPEDRPATATEVRELLEDLELPREGERLAEPEAVEAVEVVEVVEERLSQALWADGLPSAKRPTAHALPYEFGPVPTPVPVPASASPAPSRSFRLIRAEEWCEMVGAGLVTCLGVFLLLFGLGGTGAKDSLLWGGLGATVVCIAGYVTALAAQSSVDDGLILATVGLGVLCSFAILGACFWLMQIRADFAWYWDLLIAVGLSFAAVCLAGVAGAGGYETGQGESSATMALLNSSAFCLLGSVLLTYEHQLAWWTTVLSGLVLWTAGLLLTLGIYEAVDEL